MAICSAKATLPTGPTKPDDVDRHVSARVRERRVMFGLTQQLAELIRITRRSQPDQSDNALPKQQFSRSHLFATARKSAFGSAAYFRLPTKRSLSQTVGSRRPTKRTMRRRLLYKPLVHSHLDPRTS